MFLMFHNIVHFIVQHQFAGRASPGCKGSEVRLLQTRPGHGHCDGPVTVASESDSESVRDCQAESHGRHGQSVTAGRGGTGAACQPECRASDSSRCHWQ